MAAPGARAGVVVVGFIAACAVAGTAISLSGGPGRIFSVTMREILGGGLLLTIAVCFMALIPASIAITHAENNGVRSVWFYVLWGVGAGVFPLAIGGIGLLAMGQLKALLMTSALLGLAGAFGGLTYWAIAGRHAGNGNITPADSDLNSNRLS